MGFFQWPFRPGLTRLEGLQDLRVAWSRRMRAIRRCSAVAPDSMPATRTIFTFSVFFPPVPCFPELELVVYVCNKVNSNKGAEACITMRQPSVLPVYYRFCYRGHTFPAPHVAFISMIILVCRSFSLRKEKWIVSLFIF